ncbi:hypothetical protein GCM10029978_007500 [Actinoallomurus acanthiterrae]
MSHPMHAALAGWTAAFDGHDPDAMAELFTADALFQGFGPEPTVGRDAVRAYYKAVPLDRTARGKVLHTYTLGEDVAGGFADVIIRNPKGWQSHVYMSLVLVREGTTWRINSYHVSPVMTES